ncbi:hypothetical protein EDB86DRAFT_1553570 [Lactarius hatsudake]|nr:hypothetical protein EDB86DRAFT_1553570 [Lactarius hatsudake]
MYTLSALTLPAFDVELLAAVPGKFTCSTLPDAFHDDFLAATVRARLTHLTLPHLVGVPPAGAPRLAVLDITPSLAAALAPGSSLHGATLRVTNMVYDGFRPATPLCALCGAPKVLAPVLMPDVDVAHARAVVRRTRKYGCGARASRAVSSDEVFKLLQALYKQVGSLLSNVQALCTLRLQLKLAIEVAKAEEGPVASRAVEVTSAEICITLGALDTRAGGMNLIHVSSFLFSFFGCVLCMYISLIQSPHSLRLNIFLRRRVRVSPYRCHPHSPFVLIPAQSLLDNLALQLSIVPSYIVSFPLYT